MMFRQEISEYPTRLITSTLITITMKITAFLTAAFVGAASAADTLYLVNSWKSNEISSGMAYYADGHDATGGTGGSRPDDYVDVTHGSHIIWEGQPVKGKSVSSIAKGRH